MRYNCASTKITRMKKLTLLTLSMLFFFSFIWAKTSRESSIIILKDPRTLETFPGAELVRLKGFSEIPNYIRFSAGNEISLAEIQSYLQAYVGKDMPLSLVLVKQETDDLGFTHYKYQQFLQGLPLENIYYTAHVKNGKVHSMNGDLLSNIGTVNTNPILSENAALNKAKSSIGAQLYKWELPEEEKFIKWEQNDPNATFFPQSELVLFNSKIIPQNGVDIHLAYKFDIYAHKPLKRAYVFVDAITGNILFEENRIHHVDVPGTAQTGYSGSQPIMTEQVGGSYRLRETGRGNGIETYNLHNWYDYASATDFTDSDNNWNNVNPEQDQYATDAHWGSEMTYDYYMQKHNRNSLDNNGFKLRNYIHYNTDDPWDNPSYPQGWTNAFWDGQRMTFGDGNANQGYTPIVSIDVSGHEVTHGLVERTADLIYQNESGALNESFADIFGVSIDFFARPGGQANWLMGEELGGTPFRNMSNPNQYGDPDTYQGQNWYGGSGDNGGVHTNSGVQNFWYYLMVTGGSGTNDLGNSYNVTGLGFDDASKIAFRNLTVYLGVYSDYADARFYAEQSAVDIFGACSPELGATEEAWYAVGVGGPSSGGGTNFSASQTNGCSLPFSVDFSTAAGSTTYLWNFGDGGTSSVQNPNHAYNQVGTFTVELQVTGGACGSDTVTKVSYITIDTAGGCPVILPPGGTAPTQYACTGTLVDDGGLGGNYAENTGDTYITLAPTGATSIDFDFLSFDIETEPNCGWDYIEIHDGPTTGSPSLGKWCGGTPPPSGVFSSTTGIVLIHFWSDQLDAGAGFELQWTCQTGGTVGLPNADFNVSSSTVCTGSSVTFNNTSTNATSYSWSMPGANPTTSTSTSPTVTYTTAGTYTVTLTATGPGGNDTEVKTNIITVTQGPQPSFTSLPNGLAVNFTDQSTGATSWSWTFGDGGNSTQQNPSHTYASNGTYQVCLTADNANCPAQNTCNNVTVTSGSSGVPQAAASVSTTNICVGDTVFFYDQSSNNPSSYLWSFPGGSPATSTQANPLVIYNTPGVYNISLTATNALGSSTANYSNYVYVHANTVADFNQINNALTVNFIDQSMNATNFTWSFGDNSASNQSSPVHTYASPGSYWVCLTASNPACQPDIQCDSISVFPTGLTSFEKGMITQIYPNPTQDILNIKILAESSQNYTFKLTDLLGKTVWDKSFEKTNRIEEKVNLQNLPAGTYVLFINQTPHKIIVD